MKRGNQDAAMVKMVIKKYGPVLDLRKNPETLIDILRASRLVTDNDGQPCGGTPPPPPKDAGSPGGAPKPPPPEPSPPGPSKVSGMIDHRDVLKAVLTLARDVDAIKKQLGIKSTPARSRR